MSKQYAFYFDSDRCIKCYACEIACLQWHEIKAGTVKLRHVSEVTRGVFPFVTRIFLSAACRHCSDAPCAAACPAGAINQRVEDGIVVVDRLKCTGCRACLEACPDGIPQFSEDGKMQKCDMCLDRLQLGQTPFCVSSCPTQALHWGTAEELNRTASSRVPRKRAGL